MTASSRGKKALKVACALAGALVVVAGVTVAAYCDNSLHAAFLGSSGGCVGEIRPKALMMIHELLL